MSAVGGASVGGSGGGNRTKVMLVVAVVVPVEVLWQYVGRGVAIVALVVVVLMAAGSKLFHVHFFFIRTEFIRTST